MIKTNRNKVCYILPEFEHDTATHFYAKREMLDVLSGKIDFVWIDMRHPIVGMLSMLKARLQGGRSFYVHYSLKGALLAHSVTAILGGEVYYWNCGMPWLYERGRLREATLRWVLRHSLFVTGTTGLAHMYAVHYQLEEHLIKIVPNWVQVDRFGMADRVQARADLGIPMQARVILFAHHVSKRKGAHYIPEICEAYQHDPSTLFIIAGSGPEEGNLIRRISAIQMEQSVFFVGDVPNRAMPHYLAAADILIMPSEEEGFPNILLEAMASGLPFIAFNVGGVGEIIPPEMQAYVVAGGDIALFSEKLRQLLGDQELRTRLGKCEQAWVGRYDIKRVAPQFAALF